MTAKDEQISAGFVAVLGAPNAGKSTLVNRAVGAKVSIAVSYTHLTLPTTPYV